MVNLQDMLDDAIERAKKQPTGKKFTAKGLFLETEWNALEGYKSKFGVDFSNAISCGRAPNVIKLDKNKSGHQYYMHI